jgi:hypothetical protein
LGNKKLGDSFDSGGPSLIPPKPRLVRSGFFNLCKRRESFQRLITINRPVNLKWLIMEGLLMWISGAPIDISPYIR